VGGELGLSQRRDGEEGSEAACRPQGLKIRTIPTKVFVAAINSMGANATPMNFGEIYTSLQSGVLDGFEHTAATVISFKMNEVACCIALTRHLMDPTFLVFSLAEWQKLSPPSRRRCRRPPPMRPGWCARWRRSAKARRSRRSGSSA